MRKTVKKAIALVLLLGLCLPLASGCAGGGALKLQSGLTGDSDFFQDRPYALDADQVGPTEDEFKRAEEYLTQKILESAESGSLAFDFAVDGVYFSEVFTTYEKSLETTADDDVRTDYTLTYAKAGEPLTVTVYATLYKASPVIEWTVWLENTSDGNTGIITDFNGLTDTFGQSDDGDYKLLTFQGSREATVSFSPQFRSLEEGNPVRVAGSEGKPSVRWSPYYNLQWNNEDAAWGKEGVFFSVGWSGQWESDITKTGDGVDVTARQQVLNTYLEPGEKLRSPLMTLMFWEKDIMRSQNIWRDFVYNYVLPQPEGEPLSAMTEMSGSMGWAEGTTENQISGIQARLDAGLPFDYWWMDAGWYETLGGGWVDTGNWQPDPERFGDSLKPISDMCHENGLGLILWYEPERVCPYTEFYELRDKGYIIEDEGWHLYNLANDEAFEYLCEYMAREIRENGVDVYRQDCNIANLQRYWERNETEDRKGITENKYIVNYLAYFDYLLEQCPGLLIDSCASGGRRMDLETQKRSVVLWRDDNCQDPLVTQCQSFGINFFNPFSGQNTVETDPERMTYVTRSNFMQSTSFSYRIQDGDQDLISRVKTAMEEHCAYSPYYLTDYYPLTAFSDQAEDWMAWQYHDADDNSGIVQVFKREGNTDTAGKYYLSGLEKGATYVVKDIDTGESYEAKGRDLMLNGMDVEIQEAFAAKIFHYTEK